MSTTTTKGQGPSAAFFCPVPFLVDQNYLTQLRRRIVDSKFLHPLGDAIKDAPRLWGQLAGDKRAQHVAFGERGADFAEGFRKWIETGETGAIASQPSTIVSFPLLLVTGIAQWCMYLELSRQTQAEVVAGLEVGGIQGYCGGILSAVTVASAANEEELGRWAASTFRISFLLGVFMSEGEVGPPEGAPDMLIVRLKQPGQDKELIEQFPGIYASATTNPVTICFAGKRSEIAGLKEYVAANRMFSIQTYPTGTGHDPRNKKYLEDVLAIAAESDGMTLPGADSLRVPVQSDWDGELMKTESSAELSRNVLSNILCGRCEWYTVVEKLAKRVRDHYGESSSHSLLLLGGYDCVPVEPFHQNSLKVTKADVVLTMRELAAARAEVAGYSDDAVAVVGSACRLPGANTIDELWELLEKKVSKCEEVRPDRVPLYGSYRSSLDPKFTNGRKWYGNFVDNVDQFDNELFGLSHSEAAWMDPQQRILLELAYEALDSHGHLGHRLWKRTDGAPVGCFIGGTLIEYNEHTTTHGPTPWSAIGTMQAFQCGRISYNFGWYGPSETIDTACSSSLVAISRAVAAIRTGDCSMAVAGGANILGGVNYYMDLAKARFLSPTGQCKVFDVSADGYCRADGAGIIVLKKLKDALASGDDILAVIPAAGTNQGGLSKSITLPDGKAQKQLYQRVVATAGLEPKDISYIECHGTGTQAGDPNEIGGLRNVFGDSKRQNKLYVGSIKGNVGHAEAAAGVTGLMKVLAMLKKGKIPPQASFNSLNPSLGELETVGMAIPEGKVQPWEVPGPNRSPGVRRALVNSYGAAGSNASVVVCQPPVITPKSAWWMKAAQDKSSENAAAAAATVTTWPLLITAATKASLEANCRALAQAVRSEKPDLVKLLWTLSEKRQRHKFRNVVPVQSDIDVDGLAAVLEQAASSAPTQIPQASKVKHVVLVFGGQSTRTVHLDRHLYDTTPQLRHYLAECDAILTELGYPPVVADLLDHEKTDQDVLLLQTGTFAIQYSCAKTWEDAGLHVDAVVGHSFGELTALTFSGSLSLRDGIRVVAARAKLMQTAWGPEKGKMLAVHAPLETVQAITVAVEGSLEIACHNSLGSYVVVGTAKEIEQAEAVITEKFKGVRFQNVDVTHGFHSKFVQDLLPGLEELDGSLTFQKPRDGIHLELCLPDAHEGEPEKGHIGRHARNPVFFTDALTRIAEKLGPCVWLEAGTDSPIIPMAKRAVPDAAAHSFYPLKFKGARAPEKVLCTTTISLWQDGVDTTYWPWVGDGAKGLKLISLPTYRFSRKTYWTQWVDHPAELQKKLEQQPSGVATAAPASISNRLVIQSESNRFSVNVNSSRFQQIVSGHAVCDLPMCPASMYMECVAEAVQIHETNLKHAFPGSGSALEFRRISFENPLTLRPNLQVSVLLDLEPGSSRSWNFTFESGSADGKPTLHARGVVALGPSPDLRHVKSLISDRAAQLKSQPDAETIRSKRVYTLFGTLVDYSSVLRGIESLTLHSNWVVGTIKPPSQVVSPHETDSAVLDLADAAIADNFVQVLGLAINTSEHVSPGVAFLLCAVENFTLTPAARLLNTTGSWTVVSHYTADSEKNAKSITGDIYVIGEGGDVVASVLGVRFAQVRLKALGRVLDAAAGGQKKEKHSDSVEHFILAPQPVVVPAAPVPAALPAAVPIASSAHAPVATPSPAPAPAQPAAGTEPPRQAQGSDGANVALKVREIVARYTGAVAGEMAPDATMSELGIDSLAIVQFADEIGTLFNKQFDSGDLSDTNLQALIDACGGSNGGAAPSSGASDASSFEVIEKTDTVVVKEVDGVAVEVSVHVPTASPKGPLGVAILIHGGGHMALSNKTIPPSAITALGQSGFLPVSVNYRLCPEVNLVDGPMTDVLDVYRWIFDGLPAFGSAKGLSIDIHSVVAVGWSSGGHLAMSLDWMTRAAGLPPLKAILSFYAPVAWASGEPHSHSHQNVLSDTTKNALKSLIQSSSKTPRTQYDEVLRHGFATDYYSLKWVKQDDVRSQLIAASLVPGPCLPLLMRGFPASDDEASLEASLQPIETGCLEAICPLTKARQGSYRTPTFIIHGVDDDVVPLAASIEFCNALRAARVPCQLLPVSDAGHTFDYSLKYGDEDWEAVVGPGMAFLSHWAFSG